MNLELSDYEAGNLKALMGWASWGHTSVPLLFHCLNTGDWVAQIEYKLKDAPNQANTTTDEMVARCHDAAVRHVTQAVPLSSCDSSRRCPLCTYLPNGGNLTLQCPYHVEIQALACHLVSGQDDLRAEIARLNALVEVASLKVEKAEDRAQRYANEADVLRAENARLKRDGIRDPFGDWDSDEGYDK